MSHRGPHDGVGHGAPPTPTPTPLLSTSSRPTVPSPPPPPLSSLASPLFSPHPARGGGGGGQAHQVQVPPHHQPPPTRHASHRCHTPTHTSPMPTQPTACEARRQGARRTGQRRAPAGGGGGQALRHKQTTKPPPATSSVSNPTHPTCLHTTETGPRDHGPSLPLCPRPGHVGCPHRQGSRGRPGGAERLLCGCPCCASWWPVLNLLPESDHWLRLACHLGRRHTCRDWRCPSLLQSTCHGMPLRPYPRPQC